MAKSIARAIQTTDGIVVLENPDRIDSDELSVLLDPFLAKDLRATLVLVGSVLPPQIHVRDLARPSILSLSVGALSFEESADLLDSRCDGLNQRSKELIHDCTNGLIVLIDIVASQVRAYGLSNEEIEMSLADLEFEFDDYLATHVLSSLEDAERRVVDFLSASLIPLSGADLVAMIGAGTELVVRASLASLESKSVIERRRLDYTVHSAIRDRVYRLAADKKRLHETTAAILELKDQSTLVLRERHRHLVLAGHHDDAVDLLIEHFGTFWREGNRQWVLTVFEEMEMMSQSLQRETTISLLMCQVLHENGEVERVRSIYEGMLAKEQGPPAEAWGLNNAAELPARRGDIDGAMKFYERAAQLTDSHMEISYVRHNAAVLCARLNRLDEAKRRSVNLAGEINAGGWSSKRTSLLGLLAFAEGDLEASRSAASEDLGDSERSSSSDGIARAKNNLAVIALARGEWNEASILLTESLAINEAQADRHAVAQGWANLGVLRALQGNADEFEELTQHALDRGS